MNESVKQRDDMTFGELIAWAWQETPPVHKSRVNLVVHLVAVPLFVSGHVLPVIGIARSSGTLVVLGLGAIVVSLALQKFGHSLEQNAVHTFTSGRDFIRRVYAEQFVNFWRFLLSGQWYASFTRSRPSA